MNAGKRFVCMYSESMYVCENVLTVQKSRGFISQIAGPKRPEATAFVHIQNKTVSSHETLDRGALFLLR